MTTTGMISIIFNNPIIMKKYFLPSLTSTLAILMAITFSSCGSDSNNENQNTENETKKIVLNENIVQWGTTSGWGCIPEEYQFLESAQGAYNLTEKEGKLEIAIDFKKTRDVQKIIIDNISDLQLSINDKNFQTDRPAAIEKLNAAGENEVVKIVFTYIPSSDEEKQDIFENNDNCVVTIKTTIPKEEELASNSDDDDDDDVDDIYKKAKKDYDDAYSKAKSDYDKAYKQAQKDLNDALDSYGW